MTFMWVKGVCNTGERGGTTPLTYYFNKHIEENLTVDSKSIKAMSYTQLIYYSNAMGAEKTAKLQVVLVQRDIY
jgi:hypothetical protein